ncbi:hypothetical protein [Hymenobacter agri]
MPLDSAGVYLTASDLARHHLLHPVPNANLKVGAAVNNHLVLVTVPGGGVMRYPAGSIYGIRKDGQDYRYVATGKALRFKLDEGYYAIAATEPLFIYSSRYVFSAPRLYFSAAPTAGLQLLTTANLAKSFPDKPALVREISHDKKLRYNIAARDGDGQLRVAKLMAKYLP